MNVKLMNGISLNNMFNSYGGTNKSNGEDKLVEDIKFLLTQEKGRFYADPEFGSMLYSFLFLPMTEETGHMVKQEVYDTLTKFYPQLIIQYVDVTLYEKTIQIKIGYNYSDSENTQEISLELFNKI